MKKILLVLFLSVTTFVSGSIGLKPNNYVNDYTGVLSQEQLNSLNQKLSQYEISSEIEIAVAIVPNLNEMDIDTYKYQLFSEWGKSTVQYKLRKIMKK